MNDYRVNLARHRLADSENYGNYTTKAIGESLGFSSHASFINVFRNATGLTPSQYQKMSLQERPSVQNAVFRLAKHGVLHAKRRPFAM